MKGIVIISAILTGMGLLSLWDVRRHRKRLERLEQGIRILIEQLQVRVDLPDSSHEEHKLP